MSSSQLPDHELFSISLETLLSTHFMYGDPEWHTRCVASARTSNMLGETQDENRRHKKFSGYVVYVAYRYMQMNSTALDYTIDTGFSPSFPYLSRP